MVLGSDCAVVKYACVRVLFRGPAAHPSTPFRLRVLAKACGVAVIIKQFRPIAARGILIGIAWGRFKVTVGGMVACAMRSSHMDKTASATHERKSFCRICATHCGMVVTLDEQERLVSIRPDKEDQMTEGFACFKGLQAVEQHAPANRIQHPLKRLPDGSFVKIDVEQALDEITEKLKSDH